MPPYHVILTPNGQVNINGCSVHTVWVSLPEGMNQLKVGSANRLVCGANLYCMPMLMPICHCREGLKWPASEKTHCLSL